MSPALAAALHYRMELGKNLFNAETTYETLQTALAAGATIKITDLTEAFGMSEQFKTHGEGIIPLFAVDEREHIHVFSADEVVKPTAGWSVVSLVQKAG